MSENLGEINEQFLSWKDRLPKFISRNVEYDPKNNVIALLTESDGYKKAIFGKNIVCTTGSLYYTKEIGNESTISPDFTTDGRMVLQNPASADTPAVGDAYSDVTTPISASIKVIDSTYPKRNDGDSNNPGAGANVFTWRTTWTGANFDTESANDITGGAIIDTATPVGGSPLLNHWNFTTPFEKLSVASLVVWVNHTLLGV